MEWVHCNNCFFLPDNVKSFFLTSCGHIYCSDCEEHCARSKCKLCGNNCNAITLSSTMKSEVQVYFSDPFDLLRQSIKISEFQKNHRARLMSHQRKQLKKMKTVKEDFRKLIKNLKDLDNERKKLRQENLSLKKHWADSLQRSGNNSMASDRGRPISHHNSTPCSENSDFILKFGRREGWRSGDSSVNSRLSVLSPPQNGKLGFIPNTPSPSSLLEQLNLSSCSKESYNRSRSTFLTPYSSGSSVTGGLFTPPNNPPNNNAHYKKDVKKVVVHPYSPDDSPIEKDNRNSI